MSSTNKSNLKETEELPIKTNTKSKKTSALATSKKIASKMFSKAAEKPLSVISGSSDDSIKKNNYAQFISNNEGDVEYVILPVKDWERLSELDPVYKAKNKMEGLQLNVLLPGGKIIRLPHAVAVMVVIHGINLLKAWRLYRGYSQHDFESQGIKQPTVYQFERSIKNRIQTLKTISDLYGCDIDQVTPYIISTCEEQEAK